MAKTGNGMVDHKGKIIYSKQGPKDTSAGMDLGRNATNKKSSWGPKPKEASPSSTQQSRNR